MSRSGSVTSEMQENVPAVTKEAMDVDDASSAASSQSVSRKTSVKGKKATGKKGAAPPVIPEALEEEENVESSKKEHGDAATEEETAESKQAETGVPTLTLTVRGGKKAQDVKEKEENMPPKRGVSKKNLAKEEVAEPVVAAAASEEVTVPEDTVAKGMGGRKAAPAVKGRKGKKEEPPKEEDEEEKVGDDEKTAGEVEEEEKPAKAAPKGPKKGKKMAVAEPAVETSDVEEEEMPDDEEEVAAAPKKGRKATAAKPTEDEPETKKQKKEDEKPAAKGKGKKAAEETLMEEEEEQEKEKEEKPKARGRGAKKTPAQAAPEPDEEEEKPSGRPKRGAATRAAASAKKIAEEEEEQAETKPKRGAKAAPKKAAAKDVSEEDEEEQAETKPKRGAKAAPKKAAAKDVSEEDEEEQAETKPKRGAKAAPKKAAAKDVSEEDEEDQAETKPKRGAKAAPKKAAAKDVSKEDEEEQAETKPKRGAKAAPKKAAAKDGSEEDEEEKNPAPAKGRSGKQAAKGRGGRGKKAEEAGSDEDASIPPKKVKLDDDEADQGGAKSMSKSIRRTVEVKGKAAVDPLCTLKASSSHVYADGDLIYDVMLNQTNIGNNNNKYYVIQLLEEDGSPNYSVWFRWGRVGYDGQNKLVECGTNLQKAIKEFASKFEAKSKNQWPTTFEDFETYPGKYTMIEMDYGNGGTGSGEGGVKIEDEQEEEEKKCKVQSKLDERVQQLLHLMCSIRTMEQAVKSLEFDADKSPLGKLTQQQIKEGYTCLGKIEKFIERKDFGADFKQAVNEYYTKVPHACGFRPPAMIRTPQLLKQEIELLDLLSGIEYAIKTMKQETREDDVHPVDRHYASLKCGLAPMEKEEEEYKLVAEYLSKTHATTHTIQMGLKNVFRVERDGEDDNEKLMEQIGNRKLLWHGSRLSNFFGILSQGLRIAPPEAPCTGYMFGKGVYFADMASKSGNYCYASEDGQTGFLLLAEVALGEENQLKKALYTADKLPAGKNSTWGMGQTMPDPAQNKQLNDKVVVPCGKPITRLRQGESDLLYNEFIVYNTQQIRMRYLLEVEFNFI